MRYWAYFAAKLIAAAAPLYGLLRLLNGIWPVEDNLPPLAPIRDMDKLLGYDLLLAVWVALCAGSLALIVWDQRRRCRTCLRRLRMPVGSGSWGGMLLLGRPSIEYICPYGHGSLNIEEIQFPGKVPPEWTERGDIWSELFASKQADDDE